jgi:hypothetical protein
VLDIVHIANQGILPVPTSYHAHSTSKWLFTIWAGGGALAVLPYCFYRLRKHGDIVALYAWIGGFVLSLGEPMLDTLGHLWWPSNLPGPAFTAYHLPVPFLIPPCYVFFVAMTGYFSYRMFQRGITVKGVFYVWLLVSSTDLALEFPGVLTNVYKYYGVQPFYVGNFPLHWAWMNGTGMLSVGLALFVIAPRLKGIQRVGIIMVPAVGWFASYGLTSWPAFLSLNMNGPLWVKDIIDLLSLAFCLVLVRVVAAYVTSPAAASLVVAKHATTTRDAEITSPVQQSPAAVGAVN